MGIWQEGLVALLICAVVAGIIRLYFEEKRRHIKKVIEMAEEERGKHE